MTEITALSAALEAVPELRGRAAVPRFADGRASVIVDASGLSEQARKDLERSAKAALASVPGVTEARVLMTSERQGRRLIAVASGKGGVGKSTVAANLAIALSRAKVKVGLIDADIYGPSQPRLMAIEGARPTALGGKLEPVMSRFGIGVLSMGNLVAPGKAIAWRGPMAGNALGQLIDADWGDADVLIADLPPGTGDVQLSMISKHKPAGAVIVSTPQDLALIDATRAIDLFVEAGVPIIGVIENMAGYACPHCGETSNPFGSGGAEAAARSMSFPFLGRIPLDIAIRSGSDAGDPPAAGNGPQAAAFAELAARVRAWAGDRHAADR